MKPIKTYNLDDIIHIEGVDHPESISVGPDGEPYTTGTGGQVYRLQLDRNRAECFASTSPRRVLGQAVDGYGNLYCADCSAGKVLRITPNGEETTYATGPNGRAFVCTNYPAFDRNGNLYLSDSGDWTQMPTGRIYKIPPGGECAELWFPEPVYTPNAIALDADETFLYFVETYGNSVCRIKIAADGAAGAFERVVHMPFHIPDGIAFDEDGRLWIAFHRPDAIKVFDLQSRRLETFAEDWSGSALRGPTDVAFVGSGRDILLAASLDNLVIHRFNNIGIRGLRLNNPRI